MLEAKPGNVQCYLGDTGFEDMKDSWRTADAWHFVVPKSLGEVVGEGIASVEQKAQE